MASLHPVRSVILMLSILATGACGGGGGGGGGGGDQHAATSQPSAPRQGDTASAGRANQPSADTGGQAAQTPTPPAQTPAPQKPADARKPADGQAALTADTLSGSLLATMLVQNTFISQSSGGRPHPIYSLYGASPWNAKTDKALEPADAPLAFGYQQVVTATQAPTGAATFHSASFITDFLETPDFGRFTDVRTQIPLKLNLARESNAASLFLFTEAAIQAASGNRTIIELDGQAVALAQVRASANAPGNDDTLRETYTLSPRARALALSRSTQLKLGQVIREWQDGPRNLIQMLVLKGTTAERSRLCLNYHLPHVRRLHCSLWRVPQGWQFGRPLIYEGIQIQDDRSVHPGVSGMRHWKTRLSD